MNSPLVEVADNVQNVVFFSLHPILVSDDSNSLIDHHLLSSALYPVIQRSYQIYSKVVLQKYNIYNNIKT